MKPLIYLTLTALLSACQPTEPEVAPTMSEPKVTAPTTDWLTQANARVMSRHNSALAQTKQLAQNLTDVCAKKTDLPTVQNQWLATYQAWLSASSINVGPATLGADLRQIYFRPARPNLIETAISSNAHINAQAASKVGAAAKGMTALEFLLFAPKQNISQNAKRCAYAQWLGSELVVVGQKINQDMHGYAMQPDAAAVNVWVNTLISRATELAGKDLTKIAANKPEAVLSPFAGKGKALFSAQWQVWHDEGMNFADYLSQIKHKDLAQTLQKQLAQTEAGLPALPEDFAPLASQPLPAAMTQTITAIQQTQSIIENDIAPAIGVTISANDADGD